MNIAGPLAACQRRLIEGDVTDQIERVEVFANLLREFLKEEAVLFEFGQEPRFGDGVFVGSGSV